jgi:hypothetical protein
MARRRFGQVTKMRSGRWQARFSVPTTHPSGRGGTIVTAPHTFEPNSYGKQAAEDWLRSEELRLNAEGTRWRTLAEHAEQDRIDAARDRAPSFGEYASAWLRARRSRGNHSRSRPSAGI